VAGKVTKDLGVRLTADVKDLRRKLKGLEKDWDRYGRQIQKTNKRAAAGRAAMGGVAGRRGGGMGRSIMAGGAMMVGSLGLVAAAKSTKEFNDSLVDMAVKAKKGRKWIVDQRASVLKLSETWAKSPEQIAAGMAQIIKATGDAGMAAKVIGTLTKAAFATGTEISELARVANDLRAMMGITGDQMPTMLDTFAEQANLGAIEMEDMAQWFPVVLTGLDKFGWVGEKAATAMGAFFQVAKRGNTNARNTAESIKIFTRMLVQNQEKLETMLGVDLKKDGAWLQLPDLLKTIATGYIEAEKASVGLSKRQKKQLRKEGKDISQFGLLVGQGSRALDPIITMMRKGGFGASVGGQATMNELLNPAGAKGAIDRMAKQREDLDPLHKWNKAMAKMRAEMMRHMLPLLVRLARLMPDIARAAKFALDHTEELFALWVSAKAAKFFGQFIGAGKALGAGGGGAPRIRLGGGYRGPIGPTMPGQAPMPGNRGFFGRNRGRLAAGGGLATLLGLGVGGAAAGGKAGKYGDMGAMIAMGAGGIPGLAAGGAYFAGKAVFKIASAEIYSEQLNYGDLAADFEAGKFFDKMNEAGARVAAKKKGGTGAGDVIGQANIDFLAKRIAEAQAKKQKLEKKLFVRSGAKKEFKKEEEAALGRAKKKIKLGDYLERGPEEIVGKGATGGLIGGAFGGLVGPSQLIEALPESIQGNSKELITTNESLRMLRKSIDKLAKRGFTVSPDVLKAIAKSMKPTGKTEESNR